MATYCFISKCKWIDHVDNLFDHMEQKHRDHIIEVNSTNMIELNINEFMIRSKNEKPLLLYSEHGLYWFLRRKKSSDEMLLGVYHVGDSDNLNYTIRFGQKCIGWVMYYGGCQTQSESIINECRNDIYPISYFQYDCDMMTKNNVTTVNIVLHAEDEWIDTDEFPFDQHSIEWNEMAIDLNNKMIETLFCVICYEDLCNKQIITCENKHSICGDCMKMYMEKQKTVKCPCCREIIRYDARNCALERVANVLKWTDNDDDHNKIDFGYKLKDNVSGGHALSAAGVKIITVTDSDLDNLTFEFNSDDFF